MKMQDGKTIDPVSGDAIAECWSCRGPVAARALFCSVCGAVQPPRPVDHFARLGVSRGFAVDPAALEKQYFGFQRRLHPDRFATRSPRERAMSQQQATSLNEAYETLRDPLKRAAYLLKLAGHKVDIDESATISDPALLMEAIELREELAAADCHGAVAAILTRVERDGGDVIADMGRAFEEGALDKVAHLTTRLKYIGKLADEARMRKARLARIEG